MTQQQPQLIMRRALDKLPPLRLPPGVSLRSFQEGDGTAWEHIANTAFARDMRFDSKMRADPAFRPERVLFLWQGGAPVATASAWQKPAFPDTGYLHYVAVLPGAQGQGLGYWASLAALWRLRDEGFDRALLQTDDERLPAIKTYLKLGFAPDRDGAYEERWVAIETALSS